jgi:hypothetical protein
MPEIELRLPASEVRSLYEWPWHEPELRGGGRAVAPEPAAPAAWTERSFCQVVWTERSFRRSGRRAGLRRPRG